MASKALGKGLSALIPQQGDTPQNGETALIKTDAIKDSSFQPRTNYNDAKLEELKASIKEKGVLQPILVREKEGGFEVVAGERRLRAARALNIEKVPAIVKSVTDQEALVIALIENIQREELNPMEEAEAYRKLIQDFEITHDDVAQSVGKDRSTISNILRLLNLPDEMQKSVYSGEISFGHARALLGALSSSERRKLFDLTVKKGLSVRELENLIKRPEKISSRRDKGKKQRNHEIVSLEEDLQRTLGTKVRIAAQKKRGKITIEYYSLDDLDRIIRLIKQ